MDENLTIDMFAEDVQEIPAAEKKEEPKKLDENMLFERAQAISCEMFEKVKDSRRHENRMLCALHVRLCAIEDAFAAIHYVLKNIQKDIEKRGAEDVV